MSDPDVDSLKYNLGQAVRRIAHLEEEVDLLQSAWPKRLAWYLNGWPRRAVPSTEQRWRFWHRWRGRRDR